MGAGPQPAVYTNSTMGALTGFSIDISLSKVKNYREDFKAQHGFSSQRRRLASMRGAAG
jgi:hypothetical protein